MLNPAQITPPPLEAMAPIVSVTPVDRRKSFYILFSDNLRTLDGNAAFLYGVNLVVAHKDLGAFPQIFKEAWGYHERLYAQVEPTSVTPFSPPVLDRALHAVLVAFVRQNGLSGAQPWPVPPIDRAK